MLAVTILGNNSALSMHDRHQTAQVVNANDQLLLVDCGESTQLQMQRYKIRKSKINHIFISHLHGDHYYGLPGLLNTYTLNNRTEPLHLYATPALKEVLDLLLKVAGSSFGFEFIFHPITETGILLDMPGMSVACFPVAHRIACWGFLFTVKEKPERLKDGEPLRPATPALRYAYCADTRYDESILEHVSGCNLMYHETTYLDDQAEKAEARFHSTSTQAATIALKANAERLLLGHFSSKYPDLAPFEAEARQTFPASEISREGVTYLVKS